MQLPLLNTKPKAIQMNQIYFVSQSEHQLAENYMLLKLERHQPEIRYSPNFIEKFRLIQIHL